MFQYGVNDNCLGVFSHTVLLILVIFAVNISYTMVGDEGGEMLYCCFKKTYLWLKINQEQHCNRSMHVTYLETQRFPQKVGIKLD